MYAIMGITGLIGSVIGRTLLAAKQPVRAVVRSASAGPIIFAVFPSNAVASFFRLTSRSDGTYERVQTQHGYKEGIDDRIDSSYLPLMKEKGAEVRSRVKMIVASC